MSRANLVYLLNDDEFFFSEIYPNLSKSQKMNLWFSALTHDFRDFPFHDPLDKFTPENYQKWKLREPNFDDFLDVILESLEVWSPLDDSIECEKEINQRLGRSKLS
ncbi:MAG: hypothetical protein MI974_26135 [Chitinophagales bacterium]|nr:hypothetical protein [Chitinophagales bacterium]